MRLFVVARCDGRPIVWPKQTHGDPKSDAVKQGKLKPWRTAAECIDWSLPCPSIFDTAEQIMARHGLRAIRPLAPATLARIARGMRRYVLEAERPFIVNLTHGCRTEDLADPFRTITGANRGEKAVIVPALVQTGYGERPGQAPRSLDPHAPLGTVVAGGVKHAAAAAFLAQHHTSVTGHDARAPLSTIAGTGSHQMPVAAWFAKYYGTGDGARHDAPCHTTTTKDRFAHMQAVLEAPTFGAEHADRAREVAAFLRTHDAWDGGDLVTLTIAGADYVVVDIGMWMLTPRELFRAQGFPDDYVIDGVWETRNGEWEWRAFPKNVQISCCGNSVCPPVAAALVEANCHHLVERKIAA
ncbi:DNA cytosine methyltransferase [Tropicimonas sp. IMCC34043]|uniref:DNA cytosine methyltransferase n=1 Tax=Tropicimonas sp. IMCC34043 TaxID=2248760 RepID=UPI000E276B2C|nr:DNA cytosine methyltransferase [Tropicimonas sp. IMCC34043]